MVILITGKAGAGKSQYSLSLWKELDGEGRRVTRLDGDDFRNQTGNHDFTEQGRWQNLIRAAEQAARFENEGYIVLMSFVAPRKKWRNEMRRLFKQSRLVYLPGGTLWEGTEYERPDDDELGYRENVTVPFHSSLLNEEI